MKEPSDPSSPTPPMCAGEEKYKTDAAKYFKAVPGTPLTQEVGELKPLTAVLMAQVGGVVWCQGGGWPGRVGCGMCKLRSHLQSDACWRVLYTSMRLIALQLKFPPPWKLGPGRRQSSNG